MSMVIVTSRCFVLAERINHVDIDEIQEDDYGHIRRAKRNKAAVSRKKAKPNLPLLTRYKITIQYLPVSSPNSRNDLRECEINTFDRAVALKLFSEIVKQYREQNPDQTYLDKIVESFLGGLANDGETT